MKDIFDSFIILLFSDIPVCIHNNTYGNLYYIHAHIDTNKHVHDVMVCVHL